MGATFGRVKTWSSGETLTAADLNAEFQNILDNLNPAGVDDYSGTVANMQTTADPYPGSVASQATSLQGELQRIRYILAQITGETYWYIDPDYSIAGGTVIADTISEKTGAAGVTVDGVLLKDSQVTTDTINEKTGATGVTVDGVLLKDSQVTTDVINEKTGAAGVTIDGVLLKDSQVTTDVINEDTGAAGVTIDGMLIKDGGAAAVSDGTNIIKTKIVDIGAWNMDSDSAKTVNHGITNGHLYIRGVNVIIRPDTGGGNITDDFIAPANVTVIAGSFQISDTAITLTRVTGGNYDNTSYDDTAGSYNRGWVCITYV